MHSKTILPGGPVLRGGKATMICKFYQNPCPINNLHTERMVKWPVLRKASAAVPGLDVSCLSPQGRGVEAFPKWPSRSCCFRTGVSQAWTAQCELRKAVLESARLNSSELAVQGWGLARDAAFYTPFLNSTL